MDRAAWATHDAMAAQQETPNYHRAGLKEEMASRRVQVPRDAGTLLGMGPVRPTSWLRNLSLRRPGSQALEAVHGRESLVNQASRLCNLILLTPSLCPVLYQVPAVFRTREPEYESSK